jgi:hypothetical protein
VRAAKDIAMYRVEVLWPTSSAASKLQDRNMMFATMRLCRAPFATTGSVAGFPLRSVFER